MKTISYTTFKQITIDVPDNICTLGSNDLYVIIVGSSPVYVPLKNLWEFKAAYTINKLEDGTSAYEALGDLQECLGDITREHTLKIDPISTDDL